MDQISVTAIFVSMYRGEALDLGISFIMGCLCIIIPIVYAVVKDPRKDMSDRIRNICLVSVSWGLICLVYAGIRVNMYIASHVATMF